MLAKDKEYKFYEIINELRNIYMQEGTKKLYQDNNWCVYSQIENVELDSDCYIDEYPEIDKIEIQMEVKLPKVYRELSHCANGL